MKSAIGQTPPEPHEVKAFLAKKGIPAWIAARLLELSKQREARDKLIVLPHTKFTAHIPDLSQSEIRDEWFKLLNKAGVGREERGLIANPLADANIVPWIPLYEQHMSEPTEHFYENKQIPSAAEFLKDKEIRVMDASGGPDLNLGDLDDMGVGKIFRKQPGYKGTGFGFKYFATDASGTPHLAVIDLGHGKMHPGDEFFDEH